MGRELSGVVEGADAGVPLATGDAVDVMPSPSCGACVACRQGKTNGCTAMQVLGVHRDGALTEYPSVPAAFVKAEGISLEPAAMREFLAIGAHAVRRGEVAAGQKVLAAGAGPIGLATLLVARLPRTRGAKRECESPKSPPAKKNGLETEVSNPLF